MSQPTTQERPEITAGPAAAPEAADEVFLLPSAGFFADPVTGAGHVQLPDDFFKLESDTQFAILSGWRRGIEESWRRSLVQLFRREYNDHQRPLPERLEQFKQDFAKRGVEIPGDFTVALQRY